MKTGSTSLTMTWLGGQHMSIFRSVLYILLQKSVTFYPSCSVTIDFFSLFLSTRDTSGFERLSPSFSLDPFRIYRVSNLERLTLHKPSRLVFTSLPSCVCSRGLWKCPDWNSPPYFDRYCSLWILTSLTVPWYLNCWLPRTCLDLT